MSNDETISVSEEVSETHDKIRDAFLVTSTDFAKLPVKERDEMLFIMMREMYGELRSLAAKVQYYETEVTENFTPEKIMEKVSELLGGLGGGLFKGLL